MKRHFISMQDILVGIGYFLEKQDSELYHDVEKWNKFFYNRKSKNSLLKNIGFREGLQFPESRELEQAYNNLISTGLLYWKGLDARPPHVFSPSCKDYFENYLENSLTKKQLKELRNLSAEFQEEFSYSNKTTS